MKEEDRQTILIVDDSILVCQQIKIFMKDEAINILEAHSGKEAEEVLKEQDPDLILLDVVLPDIEGYELCRKIKEGGWTKASVVFITSKDSDADIVKGFSLGACDYIKKPFGAAELRSRLKAHLEIKRQRDELDKKNHELQDNMEKLNYMAFRDGLTGLYNRRYVKDDLVSEIKRHDPGEVGNYIVMADVDNFKQINDRYGHDAGDKVLICISNIMEDVCRRHKVIRWGGEEFMIVLFSVTKEEAFEISENVRKEVEAFPFFYNGKRYFCSITLGITHYDDSRSVDSNIVRADQALYYGKKHGKNRSIWYEEIKDEQL